MSESFGKIRKHSFIVLRGGEFIWMRNRGLRRGLEPGSIPDFVLSSVEWRPEDEKITEGRLLLSTKITGDRHILLVREEGGGWNLIGNERVKSGDIRFMMSQNLYVHTSLGLGDVGVVGVPVAFMQNDDRFESWGIVMEARLPEKKQKELKCDFEYVWVRPELILNGGFKIDERMSRVLAGWYKGERNLLDESN